MINLNGPNKENPDVEPPPYIAPMEKPSPPEIVPQKEQNDPVKPYPEVNPIPVLPEIEPYKKDLKF